MSRCIQCSDTTNLIHSMTKKRFQKVILKTRGGEIYIYVPNKAECSEVLQLSNQELQLLKSKTVEPFYQLKPNVKIDKKLGRFRRSFQTGHFDAHCHEQCCGDIDTNHQYTTLKQSKLKKTHLHSLV